MAVLVRQTGKSSSCLTACCCCWRSRIAAGSGAFGWRDRGSKRFRCRPRCVDARVDFLLVWIARMGAPSRGVAQAALERHMRLQLAACVARRHVQLLLARARRRRADRRRRSAQADHGLQAGHLRGGGLADHGAAAPAAADGLWRGMARRHRVERATCVTPRKQHGAAVSTERPSRPKGATYMPYRGHDSGKACVCMGPSPCGPSHRQSCGTEGARAGTKGARFLLDLALKYRGRRDDVDLPKPKTREKDGFGGHRRRSSSGHRVHANIPRELAAAVRARRAGVLPRGRHVCTPAASLRVPPAVRSRSTSPNRRRRASSVSRRRGLARVRGCPRPRGLGAAPPQRL